MNRIIHVSLVVMIAVIAISSTGCKKETTPESAMHQMKDAAQSIPKDHPAH